MSANSFFKGCALLLALSLFSILFSSVYQPVLELLPEQRFQNDSSYVGVSASDSYARARVYGLSVSEGIPATRNALWHALQIGCSYIPADIFQLTTLANFVFVMLTLIMLWRITGLMDPRGGLLVGALMVAACSGALFSWASSGGSTALVALFAMWALYHHVKSIVNYTPLLPLKMAGIVGLGVMMHLEMSALWLAFGLHALWVSIVDKRSSSFTYTLTQLFTGILIMGVCLWPLVNWNMLLLNVPWPATLSVEVAGDASIAQSLGFFVQQAMSLLLESSGLHGSFFILYALALIAVVASSIRSVKDRILWPLYLVPVLVVCIGGLFSSILGVEGVAVLCELFQPFMLVLIVFGLFRIVGLISPLLGRFSNGMVLPILLGTLGTILIITLSSITHQQAMAQLDEEQAHLQEQVTMRSRIQKEMGDTLDNTTTIYTDLPGWLSYIWDGKIIDAHGNYTPVLVSCQDPSGKMNPNRLKKFFVSTTPGYVYLKADTRNILEIVSEQAGDEYSVEDITPEDLPGRLLALTWNAAP